MKHLRESKVIFVDWHRTLSDDLYWASMRNDPGHPLAASLDVCLRDLFRPGSVELDAWMRSELTSGEIVAMLDVPGIGQADLLALLRSDCVEMRLHPGLTDLLAQVGTEAMVVVATDNSDAFAAAFADALAGRGSRSPYTLGVCAAMFDDLICSSDVGTSKADPGRFFGGWLRRRGLDFQDAVLVDDSLDNLGRFTGYGGGGVRWSGDASLSDVASAIRTWLDGRGR